jgi:hypothetical protein
LALQLFQYLFDRYRIEYVLGRSRENGEDGEGAVLLVLLKAPPQTVYMSVSATLASSTPAYFSFAMRSSLMRCLVSEILPSTYCPAR